MPGKRSHLGPTWHDFARAGEQWDGDDPIDREAEFVQSAVCFGTSPTLAWLYSHGVWRTTGTFDLWEVGIIDSDDVEALRSWGAQIREVRIYNRIPKGRLEWVGERTVTNPRARNHHP